MSRSLIVDIFAEDRGHEEFLKPMLSRIADEEGVSVLVQVRSARGGHGRAVAEYRAYQKALFGRLASGGHADIVIVAIDGNCSPVTSARRDILRRTDALLKDRVILACPDPHVERWYLADPTSFNAVVGFRPTVPPGKCKRYFYKNILRDAVRQAGRPAMFGGIEFAREIVANMNLYRAGKADSSLKAFVDDYRSRLIRVSADRRTASRSSAPDPLAAQPKESS